MTWQGIRGALVVVLPAWVTARLLVGMGWLVAQMLADGDEPGALGRGLLAWDGDWYRSLMVHGYDGMPLEGVRFFPGYVFLSRAVDAILPGGQTTALLVVANLGTLLAMVLLHRLVILESADIGTARRAV